MPTILARLTDSIGLSPDRAHEHLRSGFVRVDGHVVHDPDSDIPDGARIVLSPEPVTDEGA
jgi:hypothetical protein